MFSSIWRKNQEKLPSKYGKMREKRRGNWFPLPPPFWMREGKNERTRRMNSLSRVRAFLFLSREFFFRRSRERGEKNIIIAMRKISHSRRDDNENENVPKAWTRRVRSRPKLYQPRVSQTRTSRRARAPWAFSKSSRRERRKTQSGDALRRTSSLVFCWWGCYYAVNHIVCYFFAPVSYFPPPLFLLSRYIILCSIRSRRIHRRDKKEQLRCSRARDRQTELLKAFRWFDDDAWINNWVYIYSSVGRYSGEMYQFCGKKESRRWLGKIKILRLRP